MASRAAYGPNPHPGVDPNNNADWGSYQWPLGVPSWLLAVVTVPGGVRIVIRKELAELVSLMYQIADVKYGRRFTRGWTGGYQNRPIAGTFSPSNHSKGRAIDNDASVNPMSYTFQSDIPPGLIADWESLGWYWGGRYTGKFDTMHIERIGPRSQVATDVVNARRILANAQGIPENPTPGPKPPTPTPEDSLSAAEVLEIKKHIDNAFAALRKDVVERLDTEVIPDVRATNESQGRVERVLADPTGGITATLEQIKASLGK